MATGKLILVGPKGNTTFLTTGAYTIFNYIHMRTLHKGKYTVLIDNEWSPEDVKDFTMRIYADTKIAITAVPASDSAS